MGKHVGMGGPQALICTAVGLPASFFRRLTQSNAATTVLDFLPAGNEPPFLVINRLNQVRPESRSTHIHTKTHARPHARPLACTHAHAGVLART